MSLNPTIETLSDEDLIRCAHDLNTSPIAEDSPIRLLVQKLYPQNSGNNFLFHALALAPAIAWELARRLTKANSLLSAHD